MLYTLFQLLDKQFNLPGAGVFQYISFRAALAVVLALLVTILFGRRIIRMLQRHQIGEEIRDLGLEGQLSKKGTPTMGGLLILLAILVPILLVGKLDNIYVLLMIISTIWLGVLGFMDDYIKSFRHNKDGLKGKFKIVGQVGLGIIVGTVMCFSQEVVIREKISTPTEKTYTNITGQTVVEKTQTAVMDPTPQKTTKTTIPFIKDNEFDYGWLVNGNEWLTWLLYIAVAIFVVTAVSNGANLTDGLDGLLTTVSVPIVMVLGALAYLSGHIIYADYLNIMYIPESAELVVFAAAMCGGEMEINGVFAENIAALLHKLRENGCKIHIKDDKIYISSKGKLKAVDLVETMPFPGFPTDLQAQYATLCAVADGTTLVVENLFETRFKYAAELKRMGADITVRGRAAMIRGVQKLHGACVTAGDLRGGAALVLAGLAADGQTNVFDLSYVDRGYADFEYKLRKLGAKIRRVRV